MFELDSLNLYAFHYKTNNNEDVIYFSAYGIVQASHFKDLIIVDYEMRSNNKIIWNKLDKLS